MPILPIARARKFSARSGSEDHRVEWRAARSALDLAGTASPQPNIAAQKASRAMKLSALSFGLRVRRRKA